MKSLLKDIGIGKNIFNDTHCYKGRNFESIITEFNSVLSYLKIQSLINGNAPFIIEVNQGKKKRAINYKDFYSMVLKRKCILRNNYDIQLSTKVAILPENTINSVCTILAVMLSGGIAVIINPNEPSDRINQQIKNVKCLLTIVDNTYYSYYSDDNTITTQKLIEEEENYSGYLSDETHINLDCYTPAIIMYTTGTTSVSKPVVQMHYNISINCHSLVQHHNLSVSQTLLCILPIYHVNGLEFTIFASMVAGSCIILCDAFDPYISLKLIDKYKVTIASLVPTMLDAILMEEKCNTVDLSSLKYFVTAASPLSSKTANLAWNKCHKKIIQGYGLTETTNFSTLLPINISENDYNSLMLNCDIPSIGQEILGNEIIILNDKNMILTDGEEGEICIRGHNVMAGYLYNSDATKACFKGGWFHSGDIGKFICLPDSNKKFLKITGRIKNIIKINGNNVSLEEIDRLISNIDGIQDCITCAINDHSMGELPISFVVKHNDLLTEKYIIEQIAKNINYQSLPKRIIFVSSIPRMKNGKVNRSTVLEIFQKSI